MKNNTTISQKFEYFLFYSISLFLAFLPKVLAKFISKLAGIVLYYTIAPRKELALKNMTLIFPEKTIKQKEQLLLSSYTHISLIIISFLRRYWKPNELLAGKIQFNDEKKIKELKAQNKGLIIFLPHFGDWELLGSYISKILPELQVIAKRMKNPLLENFISKCRLNNGLKVVYKEGAMKEVVKIIKNKSIAVMLVDQDAAGDGVDSVFFNQKVSTIPTPVALALRYNVPIIPSAIFNQKNGSYSVFVGNPLEITRTGNLRKDIIENTNNMNKEIEKIIIQAPEQWFAWFHNRFGRDKV